MLVCADTAEEAPPELARTKESTRIPQPEIKHPSDFEAGIPGTKANDLFL